MRRQSKSIRVRYEVRLVCCALAWLLPTAALMAQTAPLTAAKPVGAQAPPLNEVVAVVKQQVLLASDVDREMRLAHLLPGSGEDENSASGALSRLITRLLIEQQIRIEDPDQLNPDPAEVQKSLIGLRQDLPACKLTDCMTDSGWKNFLASLSLTPDQVAAYWKDRYAVLGFIEQRFRSGIRISQQEIADYYRKTLLPQYRHPQDAPPLKSVSSRIEEILLQQRVNALLDEWVQSLRDQGRIEIVDATLRAAEEQADQAAQARDASEKQKQQGNGESAP